MGTAKQLMDNVMRRSKVDAILFWNLENIRYLCGFTGSDGVLIVSAHERTFMSDSRYEEQAQGEIRDAHFQKYKRKVEGVARLPHTLDYGIFAHA